MVNQCSQCGFEKFRSGDGGAVICGRCGVAQDVLIVHDEEGQGVYDEHEVKKRSQLCVVGENGRKRRKDTKYGLVEPDVELSSAELYSDVFQFQLQQLLGLKEWVDESDHVLELGRVLFTRWVGNGGLFARAGSLIKLVPLECTLWLCLAVFRLCGRSLAPVDLLSYALQGAIPFVNALEWERERLGSALPVVINNSMLLGLFASKGKASRSMLVEQSSSQLHSIASVTACGLCAGASALLKRSELQVALPSASAILYGARQVFVGLPAWSESFAHVAWPLLQRVSEPVLSGAVGAWLLRSSGASADETRALAEFVARSNRQPLFTTPAQGRASRFAAEALQSFAFIAPRAGEQEQREEQREHQVRQEQQQHHHQQRESLPLRIVAAKKMKVFEKRLSRIAVLPEDAVAANVMSRLCGCDTSAILSCLAVLDKTIRNKDSLFIINGDKEEEGSDD